MTLCGFGIAAGLVLAMLPSPSPAVTTERPEDLVQLVAGTHLNFWPKKFLGNVLPVAKMPNGFNDWAPQTSDGHGPWWFHPGDTSFQGMRCTHQPSPWIGDWGWFVVQPHCGESASVLEFSKTSPPTYRPYLFTAHLEDPRAKSSILLELAPTSHAAIARVTFPDGAAPGRLTISAKGEFEADGAFIRGSSRENQGGVPSGWQGMFIVMKALSDLESSGVGHERATFTFKSSSQPVLVAIATSLISEEQAELNLEAQIGSAGFDHVVEAGRTTWNTLLRRVEVDLPSDERLRVFYTNLWRANLYPRYLQEVDASGMEKHFSPYTGKVVPGKLVTDSGFWDAYRSVYSLQSLVNPTNLAELVQGWVQAYEEAGWLPQWPSPGVRESMVGTMGDVVLADAIAKEHWGVVKGFNVTGAWEAIWKDASVPGVGLLGRACFEDYEKLGFVPESEMGGVAGCPESVSRTLNYYVADAAIARAAEILGNKEERELLEGRSKRYGTIFNTQTQFFQPKSQSGEFLKNFDPLAWRNGFTEASAWQFRFELPHDVDGLKELYQGHLCDRLGEMFSHTKGDAFHPGGYHVPNPEMRQLQAIYPEFGLYAHNNQPVHAVLWVAKKAGCDEISDKYLRKVNKLLYTLEGWSGDEDNGEMGAWHILGSLGIYMLEGAKDEVVIGSPSVNSASIQLPRGKKLHIVVSGQGEENVYVDKVTWTAEGKSPDVLISSTLPYTSLMAGGVLTFTMSSRPRHAVVLP